MVRTRTQSSNPGIRVGGASNAPPPPPIDLPPGPHSCNDASLTTAIIRWDLGLTNKLLELSASKVGQQQMEKCGWAYIMKEGDDEVIPAQDVEEPADGSNPFSSLVEDALEHEKHENTGEILAHLDILRQKWIKTEDSSMGKCIVSVPVKAEYMKEDWDYVSGNGISTLFLMLLQLSPTRKAMRSFKGKISDYLRRQTLAPVLVLAEDCGWVQKERSGNEPYEPQLFVRKEPSMEQMMSLVWFAHIDPPDPEKDDGEGHVEKRLGAELLKLIKCPKRQSPWKVISNTSVKFPNGLSASTKGANPDFCEQSSDGNVAIYLIVPIVAEAKEDVKQESGAVAQMSLAIHPTLLMLIILHYRKHGWDFDTPLDTVVAKRRSLDSDAFIFSIFYCNTTVNIYANYPSITRTELGGTAKYAW
ncbi:hypothetical protein OBBRIDRAFT_889564 [Obba rivulosa]|uniref:Uncharacterized protein n=1 Tax=Obba rivulosa TaxID=1052685 RepID=A0A8E2DI50_9APHY|nr:hypothetical protein OBBRIDRAFT_889564 [Obba rivulosa]